MALPHYVRSSSKYATAAIRDEVFQLTFTFGATAPVSFIRLTVTTENEFMSFAATTNTAGLVFVFQLLPRHIANPYSHPWPTRPTILPDDGCDGTALMSLANVWARVKLIQLKPIITSPRGWALEWNLLSFGALVHEWVKFDLKPLKLTKIFQYCLFEWFFEICFNHNMSFGIWCYLIDKQKSN